MYILKLLRSSRNTVRNFQEEWDWNLFSMIITQSGNSCQSEDWEHILILLKRKLRLKDSLLKVSNKDSAEP